MSGHKSDTETHADELQSDAQITTADGEVVSAEEALAQAESSLAEVVAGLDDWADEDVQGLIDACAAAKNSPEDQQLHFEVVFSKSHNLKGLGSSFGFDLVTEISDLLCDYLRNDFVGDIQTVSLLVQSLKFVLDHNMQGDGGDEGRALLKGLIELTKKQ